MALTPFNINALRPKDKPYKVADGGGLHILVQPNGNKFWRYRYQFAGKEKMLALGSYPATPLADARAKRNDARKLIEAGTDPSVRKKLDRIAAASASRSTFAAVAEEHVENMIANGLAPITVEKHRWLLLEVAASLAKRPVADIVSAEVLEVLKRVEKSGRRETAKRLRAAMGAVFRLAIVTLRASHDPTVALKGALLRPNVKHLAAITDEKQFGAFLRALDEFDGWPVIRSAMTFLTLTCARPGEVRLAMRNEFNFEKAVWRIPAERTKMRRQHDVPLSRQALAVVQDIWSLSDAGGLVFPSIRSDQKALSENAMNAAMRRMGYTKDEVTSHGFRSTASTILNERGYNADVIEAVLGHQPVNAIRRTYNRAGYWPERVKLMQEWADMLDAFRKLPVSTHS